MHVINLDKTNSGAAVFSARMAVRAAIPGFLGSHRGDQVKPEV